MRQLRIYDRVFRIEKTVYSIHGIPLPLPISYRQLGFFVATLLLMLCLEHVPPVSWIDLYLVKFIAIPCLAAWFFTQKTLDGKLPHRFLWRSIEYLCSAHILVRYKPMRKVSCPKYTLSR